MTSRSPTLRQRLRNWALRRQPTDRPPFALHARRVYILPTRAGWVFASLIAVMFVAGMNYGNGLAMLLAFWLAGFAVVAMVRTQRSLARTRITALGIEPGFAGGTVRVQLRLSGSHAEPGDLQLDAGGVSKPADARPDGAASNPDESGVLQLQLPAPRRGHWRLPVLRLQSVAPFGLFRTWSWLKLDAGTIVYPRPHGALPVPEGAGADNGHTPRLQGHDELAWLRSFREGDSPRQVAWKAYARGAPLLVREYHGNSAPTRDFDFEALQPLDTEARLSQLARWIVDAAARGEGWVLRLPGSAPQAGAGDTHYAHCLTQLAVHGLPPPATTGAAAS